MLTSVRNIAIILRTFRLDEPELSLSELARAVNMPKSTVYKLVCTLMASGFLQKDDGSGKYRPSIRMFEMSQSILNHIDLVREATPFIKLLAKQSGETTHLTYYENGETIWVLKVENPFFVQLYSRVGRRAPAAATASGKAILACLPPQELQRVLIQGWKTLTEKTALNDESLLKDLEQIRRNGYAVQVEEVDMGIASVGAAIFDYRECPVAGISLAGPVSRFTPDNIRRFGRLAKETAFAISERIGYHPRTAKQRQRM